ncbi:MAG: RNA polymerase-associated protein [Halothiobacillaceae bacterium]|nr:MAG: RNA polymerase-associated protein [Halothiobacillaceae bacterium]
MVLYTSTSDPSSHRVRFFMAEKSVTADVIEVVEGESYPEDLIELSPYGSLPTLVDRELVVYHAPIIMEYLDERYPHPPLMPVDPVARARCRLCLYRIERDWYSLIGDLEGHDQARRDNSRKILRDSLISISPIFQQKPFFMSNEFSIVDCYVAPILWRLRKYCIELPPQTRPLLEYIARICARRAFVVSLTEAESVLHKC